jgi:hypothetical protein
MNKMVKLERIPTLVQFENESFQTCNDRVGSVICLHCENPLFPRLQPAHVLQTRYTTMATSYSNSPAQLPSISLAALFRRDNAAAEAVGKACEENGFFYLDLNGVNTMTKDWMTLLGLAKQYFEQPLEVKKLDNCHSDTWG